MQHRFWRYRQRKEAAEIHFMQSLDLKGKTALDIGANKGVYSYWLSRAVGKQGHVVAFEPQPELQQHLEDLLQTFALTNTRLVASALSNSEGTTRLYRSKAGAGDASFTPESGWESVNVQKQTLDNFVRREQITDIAYIKCDVEGHELATIQGAIDVISQQQPILQIECHDNEARQGDLFRLINSLGYDGFFFLNRQKIHYSEFHRVPYRKPETDHRNYLFTHSEGHHS